MRSLLPLSFLLASMSQAACVWPQIERYYLIILPWNSFTILSSSPSISPSLSLPLFPLLLFFLFLSFLGIPLPLYIFFKRLFAALTAKLSANEDVSTPDETLGYVWSRWWKTILLLSSIPPAGKRWNHRQHSQTSGLIEQKKHDGETEERSTFRAPLCNGVSAIFPSNIPYLKNNQLRLTCNLKEYRNKINYVILTEKKIY